MKKTLAVTLAIAISFTISACTRKETITETASTTKVVETLAVTTTEKAETIAVTTQKSEATTVATTAGKPIKKVIDLQGQRSRLSAKEKAIYDEYLPKIQKFETFEINFDEVDYEVDTFDRVIDAIFGDYPETWLFMRCVEECDWYDEEGEPNRVLLKSVVYAYNWLLDEENFDKDYMKSYIEKVNLVCDEIIADMPSALSRKSQYEWLGKKICEITEYTDKSDFNNDPKTPEAEKNWSYCYADGPLLYGEGVCQAYSYAYQWLCHRAGLWCVTCSGGCHCWNVIMLEDGLTYHVDLTWADDWVFYDYFCLTQEEIEVDHTLYDGEWIANGK